MNKYLNDYYSNYDEEGRLLSQHGKVEYHTTMHYINSYLKKYESENAMQVEAGDKHEILDRKSNIRICEIGAGTGRYSVTLAHLGYDVTAVELVEHNIEVMKEKVSKEDQIQIYQGNALELNMLQDNQYDMTLLLGPMYHLYNDADHEKALEEAIRVTKPGGVILVAYCLADACMYQEAFCNGHFWDLYKDGAISDEYQVRVAEQDLFALVRTEDVKRFTTSFPVERLKMVAADGLTNCNRPAIDTMEEKLFEKYLAYHLTICEREDLMGATNHLIDILQKKA